jgi:tetratricopeptide (TPR) repeat protein
MRNVIKSGLLLKGFLVCSLSILLVVPTVLAFGINKDGEDLILQASQAYTSDMRNRPTVTEPQITGYVETIAHRLVPEGKSPPSGVTIQVTVLESPMPELYSYVDGHLILTTGTLFAMENEAQVAGVMAHEVANLVEGYYIQMYQAIKAAERRQRWMAATSALFGAMLDVAVDYAAEVESIRVTEQLFSGESTYGETLRRLAAIDAAQSAYYSMKDVIASIPPKDETGNWVDPRLRFEPVADAQGMEYLALAGYDTAEAARGWEHMYRIKNAMARDQEQAFGPWAAQIREMQTLMEINMRRLRQYLGASGLVQTLSDAPPSRATFVAKLTNLKEVKEAEKVHGRTKGRTEYTTFFKKVILPRARKALEAENYEQAYGDFRALYDKGIRSAPIVYGIAKSKLGDFAFGASEAEKQEAEKRYREAARLDPTYALPYRGLGELYEDWERYGEAAQAYQKYLKLAPQATDSKRIQQKIRVLKKKASR